MIPVQNVQINDLQSTFDQDQICFGNVYIFSEIFNRDYVLWMFD